MLLLNAAETLSLIRQLCQQIMSKCSLQIKSNAHSSDFTLFTLYFILLQCLQEAELFAHRFTCSLSVLAGCLWQTRLSEFPREDPDCSCPEGCRHRRGWGREGCWDTGKEALEDSEELILMCRTIKWSAFTSLSSPRKQNVRKRWWTSNSRLTLRWLTPNENWSCRKLLSTRKSTLRWAPEVLFCT